MTFRQFHEIMVDLSLVEAIDGVCHSRIIHEQLINPKVDEVLLIDNNKWCLVFSKYYGKVDFQVKASGGEVLSEQFVHDQEVIIANQRTLEHILNKYMQLIETTSRVK
ncbi:hypothetical protein [Bacillus sp. 1P06AnD]|uniref:hypothetical protein n=1 Tax=Bacillus sp. 1P06AnD TaxID=3132208 RepID=UPI0039A3E338